LVAATVSAAVAPPVVNFDDEAVLVQLPLSRPRPSVTETDPSGPLTVLAETDTEPRLTVVPGAVMLIDPPVRVKVVVVVPVVAAPATPGRATSSRLAATRAVRPARIVLIDVPFSLSKFCLCLPYVSDVISSRNMARRQCLYAGDPAPMGGALQPVRSLRIVGTT